MSDFAERIGVSREAVRLWVIGDRIPRKEQMVKIAEETNGVVTPNDFLLPVEQPSHGAIPSNPFIPPAQ